MLFCIISYCVLSYHITLYCIVSLNIASHRFILYRFISLGNISFAVVSYRIKSCCSVSFRAVLYRIYCIVLNHIVLYRIESYCVVSYHIVDPEPITIPAVTKHFKHQRGALIGQPCLSGFGFVFASGFWWPGSTSSRFVNGPIRPPLRQTQQLWYFIPNFSSSARVCVCNHTPAKLALTRRLHTYLPFPVSERGSHLSLLPHLSLQNSGGTCLRLLRRIRQPRNCSWRLDSSERARLTVRLRRGIRAHGSSLLLLFFFFNRRKYFFFPLSSIFFLRIQPPAQRLQLARGGTKGKKKKSKEKCITVSL